MNTEITQIEFHDNMIGKCDDRSFLKTWAKRMIAEHVGFPEMSSAHEKALIAITIAFQFGQKSSQLTENK